MHTIRRINGKWCYVVQFVELASNSEGYRPDRDNICWCKTPVAAGQICSWLNGGGEYPSLVDVKWPE